MLRETRAILPSVQCPVLIMHSRCDKHYPAWNAEILRREIGAEDKRKILLDAPCHIITQGDDKAEIEREILQFLDERVKK
jgi:esterase/lipase